jgi:uncharacterized membrane protein (GlpM family)
MVMTLLLRFLLGGLVVSAFAALGDMLQPKSFAGIFGAAPSVALASLGLAFATKGGADAALDGRSMQAGATALCVYCLLVSVLIWRRRWSALAATAIGTVVWLAAALTLWALALR